MKYFNLIGVITVSLLLFSCGRGTGNEDMQAPTYKSEANSVFKDKAIGDNNPGLAADSMAAPPAPGDKRKGDKQQPPDNSQIKTDWDKKIVKTASINLEVKDYNNFYSSLREKLKSLGGYVAQEEQAQSDYKIENNMIIKVPVDQFDNAVVQFTSNAVRINERKISSQDVTTEIVDTKSRLEAKKQVRLRYMDLLGQARNMNDILSVQSEINGIQEEIESAAGRIEYLSHASVFSTINLTYYQVLNSAAKADEEKNPSLGEKFKDAFHVGWDIVTNLFIVIITIWPLLLASFFAYVLYKKIKTSKTVGRSRES